MYEYIAGEVAGKGENYLVMDCGGVGYRIYTTTSGLTAQGKCKIYTYLHVREDIFELYGFLSREERSSFELLLSVGGVGCRVALGILSTVSPQQLALALATGDAKILTAAPGVGPKLAQRILLELKGKIKNEDLLPPQESTASVPDQNEALAALMVLGYSAADAWRALQEVQEDSLEKTIKAALRLLSAR